MMDLRACMNWQGIRAVPARRRPGAFIVNFEHIVNLVLVLLLLTLKM